VGDELAGEAGKALEAHQDHERVDGPRQPRPVDAGLALARLLVAGHHRERRGDAAMRERDPRVGRDRDGRADAGNDLERNAGPRQRVGFFAAPSEDERIAALETHDPAPAPGVHDQERVDALLRQGVVAGGLAGEDAARARRLVEEARMHEPIVDDDVSAAQAARGRAR